MRPVSGSAISRTNASSIDVQAGLVPALGGQHAALVRAVHVERGRAPQVLEQLAVFHAEVRAEQADLSECGSMPISSRATSAMCRRYDGKPRITLTPHALMISTWRRVGVLAPLPVITGTAPV